MGCHTWCYKKCSDINKIRDDVFNDHNKLILIYEKYIEHINEYNPYNYSLEFSQSQISNLNNEKSKIKNLNIKSLSPYISDLNILYNGSIYLENKESHDIIRVSNYPNVMFFSFEKMKKWLKRKYNITNYNIQITDYEWERLKQYWNDNPDSIIEFG